MISTMDEAKLDTTQSAPPRLGLSSHLFSPLQRTAPVPRRLKTLPVLEGARPTGEGTSFGLEGIASSNEGRRSSLARASGAARAGGECKEGGRRGGRNELLSLDRRREGSLGENRATQEERKPSSTTVSPSRNRPNLRPSSPFVDRTNNNTTHLSTGSLPTPTPTPPPPPSPQQHRLSPHHTSQSWDNLLGVHPSSPTSTSNGRVLPPTAPSSSPSPLLLRHQPYPSNSNSRATKSPLSSNSNSSFGASSSSSKQGTGARPFTPPGRALLAPPPSSSTPPPTNFTIITTQRSLSSQSTDSDTSTSSSSSSSLAKPNNKNNAILTSPTTSPRLLVVPLAPPISRRASVGGDAKNSTTATLLTVVPSPPLSLATLELDDGEKRGLLTVEQAGTMTWGHVDTPTVEMKEEEKGLCLGLGEALELASGGGEGVDEGGGDGDDERDSEAGGC